MTDRLALVLVAVALSAFVGCGSEPQQGQPVGASVDDNLAASTGLPAALLATVAEAGSNMRQLEVVDPDSGGYSKARGVTVDVTQDEAFGRASQLQSAMPEGYMAFVSEMHFGIGGKPDQVSVLAAATPYDAVKVMGTNGWNYDISPRDVVARLKLWDAKYGLSLRGVGFDWLYAEFERQPADMYAFASEVYRFCPDVVEQGTETVDALAAEMRQTNSVYLWWD